MSNEITNEETKVARKLRAAPPTVAEYLTIQIDLCGKPQFEIARMCNFPKPNIITMIKQGKTKLPTAKIGLMAAALGVDPLHLFKIVMQEYEPDTWEMIQDSILKQPLVTENEMKILEVIREANVVNPKIRTNEDRMRIMDAVSALKPDNATRD